MLIKAYYANLNVLYLKMYQYEKHRVVDSTNRIIDDINDDMEWIKNQYSASKSLYEMSLMDILSHATVLPTFDHSMSYKSMSEQLDEDLRVLRDSREKAYACRYSGLSSAS